MSEKQIKKHVLIFAEQASDVASIRKHLVSKQYEVRVIDHYGDNTQVPELQSSDICLVDMSLERKETPLFQWLNDQTNADIIGLCERGQHEWAASEITAGHLYDYIIFKPIYDINQIGFTVKRTIEHQDSKVAIQNLMEELRKFRQEGLVHHIRSSHKEMESQLEQDIDQFRDSMMKDENSETVEVKNKNRFQTLFDDFKDEKVHSTVAELSTVLYDDIYSDVEKAQGDFNSRVRGQLLDTAKGPKILIADDERPVRENIGKILGANNYQVVLAKSGKEVLGKARAHEPHLILMDIDMPHMSGIEALHLLKRNKDTKNIPVVMMTALVTEDVVVSAKTSGAVDYIAKPFQARELIGRIQQTFKQLHSA